VIISLPIISGCILQAIIVLILAIYSNNPFGLGDQLSLRAQMTETGWLNYNVPN
jgi:hypothetical protein